ncbi:hypothetical protein [Nostoc sp. C117]
MPFTSAVSRLAPTEWLISLISLERAKRPATANETIFPNAQCPITNG